MHRHSRVLLAGALFLAACQSAAPPPPAGEHPLVNTAWRIRDVDERPLLDDPAATLVIESRERVSGHAGCNRYFGRVGLDGAGIAIDQMGSTRMACAPPVMEQEQRVLAALSAVAYWESRDDVLLLLDRAGRQRLRLSRLPAASSARSNTLVGARGAQRVTA
jgi:heat shock protein HslJ